MGLFSQPSDPSPQAEATGPAPAQGEPEAEPDAPAPAPPAPAPAPQPEVCGPDAVGPCLECEITSETVMTQPADRARRDIGVGERVRLTFSLGNANWRITSGRGTLSSNAGATVVYRAPNTAQPVTISATGGGCTNSITLSIIAPTDVRMTRIATLHETNTHKIGMSTRIFFLPDTVNFHRVEYLEDEVNNRATGVYSCINGTGHFPATTPFPGTTRVVAGFGTRIDANDEIRSGFCNFGATRGDGEVAWRIPWRYRVRGGSTFRRFATIRQVCTSAAAGQLRARKARASARANFSQAGTW